ncbi:hypothetical protein GCM10008967_31930 [Bacillus carboniphilus]|uniref:SPOR domain-containing protein n=1 Tax=Bacillus carboniphilus TaxID=86663 RepID=A0ABN0WJE0_9BACI
MAVPELIIDPGHGGRDPGGGSNEYWLEKDMVLDISLYQYKRFQELGVPVALTRNSDVYLGPDERTRIVRESGAKYCISNHINAGGGDGVETIHSIYVDGTLARALAMGIVNEGQNLRRVFSRSLPSDSSKDYYYMHRETGSVDTTIIEYGFADSSRDDVEQLRNNWRDYAEGVVKAYCEYMGHAYTPPGEEDTMKYRLVTGTFPNAIKFAEALQKVRSEFSWVIYEKADSTNFNPRYRIVTGTFTGRASAERAAEQLKQKFGWVVYIQEA